MPLMSGIYDSAYMQPVAKIKENLTIWTLGQWSHYTIEYQEPIPPSPASVVDMVVQAGVTTIAANATIGRRVVTILQLNDAEFLHVRFAPIDNVEGVIWEQGGQQKLAARNIHSRVDRMTKYWDPTYSTTTFFILGLNRDMNLECRNPMGYALPAARFMFWGNRMSLKPIDLAGIPSAIKTKLSAGDLATVRQYIGTTTWLPAEGRVGGAI